MENYKILISLTNSPMPWISGLEKLRSQSISVSSFNSLIYILLILKKLRYFSFLKYVSNKDVSITKVG